MGWTYSTKLQTKQQYVDRLLEECFPPNHNLLLASSLRGSRLWVLCDLGMGPQIGLFLLDCSSGGCWGHKDMAEADGPFYYDCPLSYLDRASEPQAGNLNHHGSGRSWRDFVRDHHAAARQRRKARPSVGDTVHLPAEVFGVGYGGVYRVTADLGRKGLLLDNYLRMSARQVRWAELVAPAPAQADQ